MSFNIEEEKENNILTKKHILLCITDNYTYNEELDYLKNNFCGNVFTNIESFNNYEYYSNTILFICGNVNNILNQINLINIEFINIIKEFSTNYDNNDNYLLISSSEVPINIYNVGLYFRQLFNSNKNYYNAITNEHEFQSLTESNKIGNAFRKGIYLTKVNKEENDIKFKLLRCSTNLNGPTDNLRSTDNEIVNKVNTMARYFFEYNTDLNHILAQTYHNSVVFNGKINKEKKAKISKHSDKTKDMPKNGIIAFCSFYENFTNNKFVGDKYKSIKKYNNDYYYKNATILTKLRFRLKKEVTDKNFKEKFEVTLYPNSVLLIPLSTNRYYTHEIVPSNLDINTIPTRMGYVIRCSNTDAIYKNNQTYIVKNNKYIKLKDSTDEEIEELKKMYLKENLTTEKVYYNNFYFSLNNGDYKKPIV